MSVQTKVIKGKTKAPAAKGPGKPNQLKPSTRRTRIIADQAHAKGITPLEYLLKIMWTEPDANWSDKLKAEHKALRVQVAISCLPYMHPRLQTVNHIGDTGKKDEMPPQITYAVDPEATDENPAD